jgi:hypothetical protein
MRIWRREGAFVVWGVEMLMEELVRLKTVVEIDEVVLRMILFVCFTHDFRSDCSMFPM